MSEITQSNFYHVVLPGDTLYKLSKQYDVPLKELIRVNNIAPPYVIYPGQQILIPKGSPSKPPADTEVYIVKKGDTLYSIAKAFNVSVEDITKLNNLSNPELIYPGQKLLIPSSSK